MQLAKKDTDYLVDNISVGKIGEDKDFIEVIFRITKICNQKCKFCFVDMTNHIYSKQYIKSEFDRIMTENKNIFNVIVQLSGGEPLVHPKVWELVDYFLSYGKNTTISMQTNAVFFSLKKNIEGLNKIPLNKMKFFVSFHSHIEDVYHKITGSTNQYSKAVEGIKQLCKSGHEMKLNIVVNSLNLEYMDEYFRFIKKEFLSINPNISINISIMSGINDEQGYLHIKYSDLVHKINNNLDYLNENNIKINNLYGNGSSCDLPFCITQNIKGSEEKLKNIGSYFAENTIFMDRTKLPVCENCRFKGMCTGIMKSYIEIFGDSEFGQKF